MIFGTGFSPLRGIANARNSRSKRLSSYDRTGGNADAFTIPVGETLELADIKGAGCINHIWFTIDCDDLYYMRKLVLRMYWDGEDKPSVEVPVGDFFGVGHAKLSMYTCLAFSMVTHTETHPFNAAMNCYLPMPFADGARITITNEAELDVRCMYFYIDYEELDEVSPDALRFHAVWNREKETGGQGMEYESTAINLSAEDNYLIMEAEGRGHYIGCNVSIDNLEGGWPGEGDDMIFIDGEKWPPSLHGTGTEDYFCAAWGFPSGQYNGSYHGISLSGDRLTFAGKWTVYRHHLEDPVVFHKSIKATIEHGHANRRNDDWSSVGYWYQAEPHKPFKPILPVEERMPRMTDEEKEFYEESLRTAKIRIQNEGTDIMPHEDWMFVWDTWESAKKLAGSGEYKKATEELQKIVQKFRDRGGRV